MTQRRSAVGHRTSYRTRVLVVLGESEPCRA